MNIYREYLWNELQNPQPLSLVHLCKFTNLQKEELIDQVPHWIFPIGGSIHSNAPRTLALLCNHPEIFNTLITELQDIDVSQFI